MKYLISLAALLMCVQPGAFAFKGGGQDNKVVNVAPEAPPQPELPELKGVVSWKTLADVSTVREKDRTVTKFSGQVAALDKKDVKLQGFMMPLEVGEKQARFILSAVPPSCAFCLPGGPDSIVEVQAKQSIRYSTEPVILSGRFVLLRDDPAGMFYRLTGAVVTGK